VLPVPLVPDGRTIRRESTDPSRRAGTAIFIPVTNPLERLNKEVKRRTEVVGIFPNDAAITRLIGAVLLEQNDEWLLQCRHMQIEGMAELAPPLLDAEPGKLPPLAA
jgi:Transposase, Mutator family